MERKSVLLHSKTIPFCVGSPKCSKLLQRPFNKHLQVHDLSHSPRFRQTQTLIRTPSNCSFLDGHYCHHRRQQEPICYLQSIAHIPTPQAQNFKTHFLNHLKTFLLIHGKLPFSSCFRGLRLYCFRKHFLGEAKIFEQLGIVQNSLGSHWSRLPISMGFLKDDLFLFFFVYHYFFFFNVIIRKQLYGDYFVRLHDPKRDASPPKWYRFLFGIGGI